MIVYGDQPRATTAGAARAEVARWLARARRAAGLARHEALCGALVAAGELAQGLADADFAAVERDRGGGAAAAAMDDVCRVARALAASWAGSPAAVPRLAAAGANDRPIAPRTGEGFAHYALYPEAYLEAARALARGRLCVIGVRSIGAALAPMVAAGARSRAVPATVRPIGHPFARTVAIGEGLAQHLLRARRFAVVDEGPGLSGSSVAGMAGWLVARGVPARRIHLFSGHAGPPGPRASAETRALWAACPRRAAGFEAAIAPRLRGWVAERLGATVTGWRDLSGGAWRELVASGAPADAARERRKYLAETADGRFLVKFAGIGAAGEATFERARALAASGLTAPPVGLAHGFLIERWIERGAARPPALDEVARYLGFRARAMPGGAGASLDALAAMAAANAGEAIGREAGDIVARRAGGSGQRLVARVDTDNRLHAWEWLRDARGALIKTDAVDHSRAHDLVGCQDIAWDVAGAQCELGLDGEALAAAIERLTGTRVDRGLLAAYRWSYPAFQLGLWTMAGSGEAARYAARLRAMLAAAR